MKILGMQSDLYEVCRSESDVKPCATSLLSLGYSLLSNLYFAKYLQSKRHLVVGFDFLNRESWVGDAIFHAEIPSLLSPLCSKTC